MSASQVMLTVKHSIGTLDFGTLEDSPDSEDSTSRTAAIQTGSKSWVPRIVAR